MTINTHQALFTRTRRTRRTDNLRRLVQETHLEPSSFVYPIFVTHGQDVRQAIAAMPGQYRLSLDQLPNEAKELKSLGVRAVLLFGIPSYKDAEGTEGYAVDGIVQQAVRVLKDADPELIVICDVCLCEYTDHGHCGLINTNGEVLNDESLSLLSEMAVTCADAGADIIAPSDMMDGRVQAIRHALDETGHAQKAIMAYSAKYSSAFYGPFREAADSTPQFGDRRGYQMDHANVREALREVEADIDEQADIVMVKPALAYLDVIRRVRERTDLPLAAYNVSGEYSMLKAAIHYGWLEEERVILETLTAIRRAGADILITYHAKEAAQWLRAND